MEPFGAEYGGIHRRDYSFQRFNTIRTRDLHICVEIYVINTGEFFGKALTILMPLAILTNCLQDDHQNRTLDSQFKMDETIFIIGDARIEVLDRRAIRSVI